MGSKDDSRKVYLDLLRIIACILVIFNHTGQLGEVGFLQFLSYTPVMNGGERQDFGLVCLLLLSAKQLFQFSL